MNILVVGGDNYPSFMTKFGSVIKYDPSFHFDLPNVDLVCFTGGADISPSLYGEQPHIRTTANGVRDQTETRIIRQAFAQGIPCVGICRGGQLLSAMNGDKLVQHANNHYIAHDIVYRKKKYKVASSHHQMMIGNLGEVLAWSDAISDFYEGQPYAKDHVFKNNREPEAVWYDTSSCLCVQFHPEHFYAYEGAKLFTKLMEEYIL